jgi:hypothetical protein
MSVATFTRFPAVGESSRRAATPRWRALRIGGVTSALAASLMACDPDPSLDPESGGEHIDFVFEKTDRALCEGSISEYDRFIERVFGFLAADLPEEYRALVQIVEDSPCPRDACYRRGDGVYMENLDDPGIRPAVTLRHELVHAVAHQAWGATVSFFAEGLAVALSQGAEVVPSSEGPIAVRDMLDDSSMDLDYQAAGLFVQFLIDTRGLNRFKQVYIGAQTASIEAIQGVIEGVYGESFADIETEYLSGAPRCLFQLDVCDLDVAEKVGSAWASTFAVSCDDPDVYGSVGPDDTVMAARRMIEIESAGTYRLTTGAHLYLSRCGDCDVQFRREFRYSTDIDIELDAGFYALEFVETQDTVVQVELAAK